MKQKWYSKTFGEVSDKNNGYQLMVKYKQMKKIIRPVGKWGKTLPTSCEVTVGLHKSAVILQHTCQAQKEQVFHFLIPDKMQEF
jgi:hypothetical protein